MMASASYPALGIDRPAVLSPQAYALLRTFGFRGFTISDAFDSPALARQSRPARQALRAGVDLLLFGQSESAAASAFEKLTDDLRTGRVARRRIERGTRRIIAFKRQVDRTSG